MSSVAVVIPCYNHARYLGVAIESALSQSRQADEIIVVDDGSTDDTAAVAARYESVTYLKQVNKGLASARNAGARKTGADFLIFLDADDRLTETAVDAGLRCHVENPGCGLVYGTGVMFYDDGHYGVPAEPVGPGRDAYEKLLRSNYIWMIHMSMYRRAAFESVGGFVSGVDATADYGLNLRIAREYPLAMHTSLVAEYRYLPDSMSRNLPAMLESVQRVMDSEWKFVAGDRRLERAWRIGKRNWKLVFTKLMLKQNASSVRNGGPWRPVVRNSAALVRYGPSVAVRAVGRKLKALKSGKPAPTLPA